jgi:hypothetical protein
MPPLEDLLGQIQLQSVFADKTSVELSELPIDMRAMERGKPMPSAIPLHMPSYANIMEEAGIHNIKTIFPLATESGKKKAVNSLLRTMRRGDTKGGMVAYQKQPTDASFGLYGRYGESEKNPFLKLFSQDPDTIFIYSDPKSTLIERMVTAVHEPLHLGGTPHSQDESMPYSREAFEKYEDIMFRNLTGKFGEAAVEKMFKSLLSGEQVDIPENKRRKNLKN